MLMDFSLSVRRFLIALLKSAMASSFSECVAVCFFVFGRSSLNSTYSVFHHILSIFKDLSDSCAARETRVFWSLLGRNKVAFHSSRGLLGIQKYLLDQPLGRLMHRFDRGPRPCELLFVREGGGQTNTTTVGTTTVGMACLNVFCVARSGAMPVVE